MQYKKRAVVSLTVLRDCPILSIPTTIQYYFLSNKFRVHPFCGAGLQCEYSIRQGNAIIPTNDSRNVQQISTLLPGKMYVNLLFTQGVMFEINTKIRITESIHFVPGNSDRSIGIDLGLGYRLP